MKMFFLSNMNKIVPVLLSEAHRVNILLQTALMQVSFYRHQKRRLQLGKVNDWQFWLWRRRRQLILIHTTNLLPTHLAKTCHFKQSKLIAIISIINLYPD